MRAGDRIEIVFADDGRALAEVVENGATIVLAVAAHRTARGTEVAARRWLLERRGDGLLVRRRL